MKKFIRNKKGFTLVEIVIVIGIVIILSVAGIAGVSESLERANQNADYLSENNGYHFEESAWEQVRDLSVNPEDFNDEEESAASAGAGGSGGESDSDEDDDEEGGGSSAGGSSAGGSGESASGGSGSGESLSGGSGSGGSGSGESGSGEESTTPNFNTHAAQSNKLKEFLEHYGIDYESNNGQYYWNAPEGGYDGKTFAVAWNEWKHGSSGGGSGSGGSGSGGSGSGESGSGGSTGTTVTASDTNSNAAGSSVSFSQKWNAGGNGKFDLPSACTEIVVYAPNGFSINSAWGVPNGSAHIDPPNGNFVRITFDNPTSSLDFSCSFSSSDAVKVYSYTKA